MKSCLITNSGINSFSGGGIVSKNIAQSLQSFGILNYIFSNEKFENSNYNGIPAYCINPDHYYSPEDGWRVSPFIQDYLAFHFLPREKIDIAVFYACPFGLTAEELKRQYETKIVCDLAPHNIEISRAEHEKLLGKYPYPHLTNEILLNLYLRHLKIADKVIVHSNSSANYIKEKAKLSQDPVVIPHGCDVPSIIPEYPEKIIPGYFGSASIDKGITYLANAWLRIIHPPEVKMIIGGREGGFQIKEEFKNYFAFTGFVENLEDFYRQISIYIHPSIIEGFGLTPLEAMAYGRPVIVSSGAGVSELITHGKDGFVVEPGNIDQIIKYIRYFMDNPDQVKIMGQNARQTAEKYTWSTIRQSYAKIFQELF